MKEKLYIIYGTGNDEVGLVGMITHSVAEAKGNIVDLRQDVLHGLFSIFLVVDLGHSDLTKEGLDKLVTTLSEETGLELFVDTYNPVPRSSEKQNLLLILLGTDKPGIIASITEMLSSYNINIEFSQMIARENVFLMDLLTDISHSSLPLQNLKTVLANNMQKMSINTMFQDKDVFNKRKRIILFDISKSVINRSLIADITSIAGISEDELRAIYSTEDIPGSLRKAAANVDGLPLEVLRNITTSIEVSAGTLELLQTLKIMGYKICMASPGFSFFTDEIRKKLDIDYAFGTKLLTNDDAKTVTGEIASDEMRSADQNRIITHLMEMENVEREDITIISDSGEETLGITLNFSMKEILDYYNQHILSREALLGLLGSYGIPSL